MKKHIIILGTPRAGKTTLAHSICQNINEYSIIGMDEIRYSLSATFPELGINSKTTKEKEVPFSNFVVTLLNRLEYKFNVNGQQLFWVIEGSEISIPTAYKLFNKNTTKIIVVGRSSITGQELYNKVRKYDTRKISTWTNHHDDEDMLRLCKKYVEQSKENEKICNELNISYYDTGEDYSNTILQIVRDIQEEISTN